MAKNKSVADVVSEIALPVVEQLGLSLWDVSFDKEGSSWYLRVFIDKESGVSFDDCEAISRILDKLLDELDPIEHSYCLEVSSAGLGRELKKPKHFEQYLNSDVEIFSIRPIDGKREFVGTLIGFDNKTITVLIDNQQTVFELEKLSCVQVFEDYQF